MRFSRSRVTSSPVGSHKDGKSAKFYAQQKEIFFVKNLIFF